jgi:hypothetical protein
MSAPTCLRCRGSRWVRYFSETTDGNFEEAFKLCPCNHKFQAWDERAREGAQNRTVHIVCSFELKVLKDLKGRNGNPPTF